MRYLSLYYEKKFQPIIFNIDGDIYLNALASSVSYCSKLTNIADNSKSGIFNLSNVLKWKYAPPLNLVVCKFLANHLQYWPRYFSNCARLFGFPLFCI